MADFTDWPTATDIEVKLKSAAYWPTDATKILLAQEQCTIAVAAVVSEFERRTGWKPFLAGATDSTWYFDATDPYGELSLDGGFVSITSVTISGNLQTLNTNYTTEPRNATGLGEPITRLNFPYGGYRYGFPTVPNSIVIVGRRGFTTTLVGYEDVWQAVQEAAAVMVLASIENLQSIASLGMDGFSKSLDIVGILTQKDVAQLWAKNFTAKVQQYSRVIV